MNKITLNSKEFEKVLIAFNAGEGVYTSNNCKVDSLGVLVNLLLRGETFKIKRTPTWRAYSTRSEYEHESKRHGHLIRIGEADYIPFKITDSGVWVTDIAINDECVNHFYTFDDLFKNASWASGNRCGLFQ